jgi:hypothetical protein
MKMIVIRDRSIKTLTKCEPFIKVITDETAIAFEKHNEDYPKSSDQIKNGLTKQDNQYYYFEHDIINTPRSFSSSYHDCFAYKVYPITDDIAQRIIKKEYVSKWEILFNSFLNHKKIYSMIKDYELRLSYISSYMLGDKLVIPYGSSPSDMREDEMVLEDYLTKSNKRYASMNEPLSINLEVLREMKLNELNIA